ncbi:transposase [Kitasatospora sp. NPDC006697]|uniref:transposase n=1 Tax=Kitasatospora sp. NPDC006697 TaxID=3364020 RepID=UPI0036BA8699
MAAGRSAAAARGAWLVFEDEAGQSMRPPRARTWGRVGCTPVVRVRGRGVGRVSMAGLSCYRPGHRSRILYSFHVYRGRKGEKKGLTWQDYRDLLGPIVLVWDKLRAHLMPPMREFIEASKDWLTVFQLPSYAPDLNPQEGTWSLVKRTIGNLAAANLDELARAVKRSLKKIEHRPHLVDGCLAATGLILDD